MCVALLALGLAGTALAGNGGLAPPSPASPNAGGIRDVYWLILAVTGGIFLLVEVTLILFVVRYRSRGRARKVEGAQIRGHTKLELAWTAGPVLILAVIVGFVLSMAGPLIARTRAITVFVMVFAPSSAYFGVLKSPMICSADVSLFGGVPGVQFAIHVCLPPFESVIEISST